MRTNFPLVLAAISIGFVADGSADTLGPKQLSSGASGQTVHALDPSFGHGGGFSALRSQGSEAQGESSLKALSSGGVSRDALVRPEEGRAWRSGFRALAPVAEKDTSSKAAIVGAPEMGRSNGFAALKAAAEKRGASALWEASPERVQRPAGMQWSNGFQNLRK